MKKAVVWTVVIVIIIAISAWVIKTKQDNREYNHRVYPNTDVDLTK